jgi:hypothetical protein
MATAVERGPHFGPGVYDQVPSQAEVEHLDPIVGQDEDVFWLDVPMHDVAGVGRGQGVGDLSRVAE